MAFQITRITDQDCAVVALFLERATPDGWRSAHPADAAQIRRVVTADASIVLSAKQDGGIIGLAVGWCFPNAIGQGDTAMLDELLVDPACRRRGVGTALVAAFQKAARQTCNPPLDLWATTDFPAEPAATPFARAGGKQGQLLRQFDWPQEANA